MSLIRVTLLFAVIIGPVRLGRCMHVSDWMWSTLLCLAFVNRSELFRRLPQTSSGEGRSRQLVFEWLLGHAVPSKDF